MRLIEEFVKKDLQKKMVFIGGPRQCGKTTLAQSILKSTDSGLYLNWDKLADRKKILSGNWFDENHLLVFDEIHKHRKWKTLIKGYFDTEKSKHQFLVTGSARLDLYQRGGDSLLGRYHYWRLHPFTLFDIPKSISREESYKRLMNVGGFPEVFLDNDEREARRWRDERSRRILQEDIRDLEQINNLSAMELLLDHLRDRVGSTLAVSNLAQEVGVSPTTAAKWIQIFEKMYLIFVVRGYDKKLTRAVHKPIKVYFFDNAEVRGDESVRFENLVATHLLARNHFIQDYYGHSTELYYVKDKNQREVDFLVTQDKKPLELIECKTKDKKISKNLVSFAEILNVEKATQIINLNIETQTKNKLQLTHALSYFKKF